MNSCPVGVDDVLDGGAAGGVGEARRLAIGVGEVLGAVVGVVLINPRFIAPHHHGPQVVAVVLVGDLLRPVVEDLRGGGDAGEEIVIVEQGGVHAVGLSQIAHGVVAEGVVAPIGIVNGREAVEGVVMVDIRSAVGEAGGLSGGKDGR